jgi:hypothetical protein
MRAPYGLVSNEQPTAGTFVVFPMLTASDNQYMQSVLTKG